MNYLKHLDKYKLKTAE